jgi:translation initiation factor 2B subunit (eIF-2B alpha/beta/delta family)
MTSLASLLDKISNDRVSGSSEIYSELLDGLQGALAQKPKVQEWRDFSDGLSKVKRSMAPLQNVAGSIRVLLNAQIPDEQFNGFVKGFLTDLRERETAAPGKIAKTLANSYKPGKVVTISYSGTVLNSLLSLPKDVEVSIAESLPMGEGALTCNKLVEKGYHASLFRDSMIASQVQKAELVMVGADGVCPEGVVNKVGTMPAALAAKEHGKPFVVLCSTSKLIPVLEMDTMESEASLDQLRVREVVFELTPLDLITAVITDEGVLSGEEMRKRLLKDRGNMKVTECQSC